MRRSLESCRVPLQRFRAATGGNITITFSLAFLPLLALTGAALDYSGASALRSRLQAATDGTNMQLCQMPATATQADLEAAARASLASYMGSEPVTIDAVTTTPAPRQVRLATASVFPTAVMRMINTRFATMRVGATSQCTGQQQTFEIALVLDNTGSMAHASGGVSKMDALKSAATTFVNRVFDDPRIGAYAKISLVPFAAAVAVDPALARGASWLDQNGRASYHWNLVQGGSAAVAPYAAYGIRNRLAVFDYLNGAMPGGAWAWTGCLESRTYPFNVDDSAPTNANPDSYFVPMLNPDESGNGGELTHKDAAGADVVSMNSFMDDTNASCAPTTDEAKRTGQACKYMQVTNPRTTNGYVATGPNAICTTRPLTRLTTARATLTAEIAAMQPAGSTNIHEGFAWGWRTLSPNAPLANGVPYGTQANNKIVILMTDGANTWSSNPSNPTLRSTYSAYGYVRNPDGSTADSRLMPANAAPANDGQTRAAMDALTAEGCRRARAGGVSIYTIGFSVAGDEMDQQGLDLLSGCAGDASKAFVATSSGTIGSVFEQIFRDIGKLRLSM